LGDCPIGKNADNTIPPKPDPGNLQRSEFINFLNSEIDNLRTEIQRPGWTKWAIIGGLAVLVWLLLQEIEAGAYSLKNATGLLLVIWSAQYFYFFVKSCISPASSMTTAKGRFLPNYLVSSNRVSIILLIGQQVFLIWVAYNFSEDVGNLATITSYLTFSLLLLFALVTLIGGFTKIPVSTSSATSKAGKVLGIIVAVPAAIVIWQYIRFIVASGAFSVFDLRFAFLVAAIVFLVSMLLVVKQHTLTLESLLNIRREFFLGRIDMDAAILYTDIALLGLRASDVLEEYVNKLLSLYREASVKYKEFSSYMDELEKISDADEESLSDEQKARRHSIIEAQARTIKEAEEIIANKIIKAWRPLKWRIMMVLRFAADDNTLDNLLTKLEDALGNLGNQSKEASNRSQAFLEQHNIET
jgi:phosphate/sulfate permease